MTHDNQPLFSGEAVKGYAERPARQVPGLAGLHRMTAILLAERMPEDGRVLVLGAGGGLELKALAEAHPGWSFDGVDPSADMLRLARQAVGRHGARMHFIEGTIAAAPEGPYDAAVCLLTFHFIPRDERLATLRDIRRRLAPGAPFVLAHISVPQSAPARARWLARHIAFGATGTENPDELASMQRIMEERLTILGPAEEEANLLEAGFTGIDLFYAGFSFRGWVAYA